MLDQGALILSSANWPHGVRIVLVTSDTGELCGQLPKPSSRPVHFNITLGPNGSHSDTVKATILVSFIYLLIGLVTITGSFYFFKRKCEVSKALPKIRRDQAAASYLAPKKKEKRSVLPPINEDEEDEDVDVVEIAGRKRLRSRKCVADLSNELKDKTRSKAVYKKSRLYLGALCLMSIFYSLPTIQMVFRLSHQQVMSGNHDICYYNNLCRRSLGSLSDFNHIFSNLGYCLFGILFMLIVWIRKEKYKRFEKEIHEQMKNENTIEDVDFSGLGVPRQYSLYYAMGLALTMEGVMSACYHVCPTEITFQFDTTFMYLIAILMFMKLYQVGNYCISQDFRFMFILFL